MEQHVAREGQVQTGEIGFGNDGYGPTAASQQIATEAADGDQALCWTPEHSLMLAILDDAIACYQKTLKRARQNPDILARQAEFWIRMEDWDSPFSFNNVCEALRLEPRATRERILASRCAREEAA